MRHSRPGSTPERTAPFWEDRCESALSCGSPKSQFASVLSISPDTVFRAERERSAKRSHGQSRQGRRSRVVFEFGICPTHVPLLFPRISLSVFQFGGRDVDINTALDHGLHGRGGVQTTTCLSGLWRGQSAVADVAVVTVVASPDRKHIVGVLSV